MGVDLSGFQAAFAAAMDGDILTQTWSIGGSYPGSILSHLGGRRQDASYSHNKCKGDSSACRVRPFLSLSISVANKSQSDAYINNSDANSLILSKFEHLYNLGDTCTLDSLRKQNIYNQNISKTTNS